MHSRPRVNEVPELEVARLLAAYDAQLRGRLPDGEDIERDGPLVRHVGAPHGGFIDYRDLDGTKGTSWTS